MGKSGRGTFQAEGTTLGKSPKVCVNESRPARLEWCELRGEQSDGQGFITPGLGDLAKLMLRRPGQYGYPFLNQ